MLSDTGGHVPGRPFAQTYQLLWDWPGPSTGSVYLLATQPLWAHSPGRNTPPGLPPAPVPVGLLLPWLLTRPDQWHLCGAPVGSWLRPRSGWLATCAPWKGPIEPTMSGPGARSKALACGAPGWRSKTTSPLSDQPGTGRLCFAEHPACWPDESAAKRRFGEDLWV